MSKSCTSYNFPLGKYKHFKGNIYEVIGSAKHSETLEDLVIYRSVENPDELWVRPKKMFFEEVEVNGEKIPRFEFME
ncbi:MAG TPA: DUF1653 domain-containing protein [Candidatus Bipolaricaulota bacterium]|nr:DUF1653 domain-containing protein [Candidatus Bipolaricaulota bacterium]